MLLGLGFQIPSFSAMLVATHDDIKKISEKLAFRKYINDPDFETIKILEQEHKEQENIKEIETRLSMTRIDEQTRENIEERENIDDIPTQIEIIRSENSSTSKCKKHGPKVNSDPDPPPSDSSDSSSLSDLARKIKKSKSKKKCRKHIKYESSDPSSSDDSDDSDSSEESHYRRRQHKNKKHWKKYPIRLCATLTAKLLTTAFKLKIIRFKLDEDPLQRRIYFLTFIDSLNMIFSQYRETYEILRDYPKMGEEM